MKEPQKWLRKLVGELTHEIISLSPSEWAETYRRLPETVTSRPGPYDYSVTPFLREIVDCLDSRCPVRQVAIMKGAQTGGTVGVLENFLGYAIAHLRTWPMMLVTATQPLAQIRMDEYIMPMLEQSGMMDRIQSNTENKRKAGATARKMSWAGGGFLIPTGSNEAANLRSVSIRAMLLDELDSYPLRVGRDGDPFALAKRRTNAFEDTRKIVSISTPTTTQESRILREYNSGDRRKFMVPCQGCGEKQELRWSYTDPKGEQKGGIVWDMEDGRLVPGSVRYACPHCGYCHKNSQKQEMLAGGEWVATAIPDHPSYRSYHISGLMSPPGFFSWESAVIDWLKAWNVNTKKPRCKELLQEFYNNVLGQDFDMGGTKLTLGRVGAHTREYQSGTVPNVLASTMCFNKISFLTCAADVHDNFISAAVYAWGEGGAGFLIGQYNFEGSCDDVFAEDSSWAKLAELIGREFRDDGDRSYYIKTTLVDSGYKAAECYAFCGQYANGVYPIKGDTKPIKGPTKQFKKMEDMSATGVPGFIINVNHYKSRLASVLKTRPTPTDEIAPVDSVSFPEDISNASLHELISEEFVCEVDKHGHEKFVWKRTSRRNELWDLTVYNTAARDLVAWMICVETLDMDAIVWAQFWRIIDEKQFGWAPTPPIAEET